jgi:hypothetical protein
LTGWKPDAAEQWIIHSVRVGVIAAFSRQEIASDLPRAAAYNSGTAVNFRDLPDDRRVPWSYVPGDPRQDLIQESDRWIDAREALYLLDHLTSSCAQAQAPTPSQPAKQKKTAGGRPRGYPWDEIGAAFGAWLYEGQGRTRLTPTEHHKVICNIAQKLNIDPPPDKNTTPPYILRWIKGYLAFFGDAEK